MLIKLESVFDNVSTSESSRSHVIVYNQGVLRIRVSAENADNIVTELAEQRIFLKYLQEIRILTLH